MLAVPKDPRSDIGHAVMIPGNYWKACDADDWYECEVVDYNPRRAFERCEQRAVKVFVQVDKADVWIKYPEYLKYRNTHQTRERSPSLFEPELDEAGASTALALTTGAPSTEDRVVAQGAFG